jgi:hypothetical protein
LFAIAKRLDWPNSIRAEKNTVVLPGPDPDHTPEDILRVFAESPDPVLFAQEVADYFDKSRTWAYNELDDLVDDGLLRTKKSGKRTRIYWISRDGKKRLYESSTGSLSQ